MLTALEVAPDDPAAAPAVRPARLGGPMDAEIPASRSTRSRTRTALAWSATRWPWTGFAWPCCQLPATLRPSDVERLVDFICRAGPRGRTRPGTSTRRDRLFDAGRACAISRTIPASRVMRATPAEGLNAGGRAARTPDGGTQPRPGVTRPGEPGNARPETLWYDGVDSTPTHPRPEARMVTIDRSAGDPGVRGVHGGGGRAGRAAGQPGGAGPGDLDAYATCSAEPCPAGRPSRPARSS